MNATSRRPMTGRGTHLSPQLVRYLLTLTICSESLQQKSDNTTELDVSQVFEDNIMALAHITLATRDVARSSAFFREVLGWRPVARPGNIDRAAAWLSITPGLELHLVE